ncbi:hypothetical protein DMUE_2436 [Dictyocoela muelleri]|nr:hypothetical protein DMUE_2436 [Dictyocoela muelleri]
MSNKKYIKNNEEYQTLTKILKNENIESEISKKSRLFIKSKFFMLIHEKLYYKSKESCSNDRLVISQENIGEMKLYAKIMHEQCHQGINKMEDLCKKKFFFISRDVIRDTVLKCEICLLAQIFKEKDIAHHITAKIPNERFQIDLIDLKSYANENYDFKWILTVIDIY